MKKAEVICRDRDSLISSFNFLLLFLNFLFLDGADVFLMIREGGGGNRGQRYIIKVGEMVKCYALLQEGGEQKFTKEALRNI